jgi:hypothetical protein
MNPVAARTASPQHYVRTKVRPLAWLDEVNLLRVAAMVADRIYRNRRRTSAGSYLLVDDGRRVLVLSEASSATDSAVRRHPKWVVGRYACGPVASYPTLDDIADDLRECLKP